MPAPLEDVTIADFSQMQQGGWATQKLGDMGADVIKIEPAGGELVRTAPIEGELLEDVSPYFLAMNRNKRSITLDLKSDEGRQVAEDIIEEADALVENFRPGVMEKFGLGYEDVHDVNENIVYVSASGFGADGPYAERPGQDILAQAMSGLVQNTGRKQDPPTPAGSFICDAHSANTIALHTVVALFQREMTGEGQKIETNLLNAGIDFQTQEITSAVNMDVEAERSESGIGHVYSGAPYGVYETADGHVALSFANLPSIADELGVEPLCDYSDGREVYEHRDEIKEQLEAETRSVPTDDLMDRLLDAGAWIAEVNDYQDAADHPQVRHNDMIIELEYPGVGTFETTGVPVSMSNADVEFSDPPVPGEQTEEVLAELGYDDDEIANLEENGVTASEGGTRTQ
ncbi:CaiB/BaiF CoA transferase family protein [Halobacterium wangiae]|uniref:CaiB/BaiF CoA transferase family protein n=1 Tax=Halobacterium wangiae TaxID=2902623 RepID=UPI001E5E1BDD|nr:CaiB/BaiF CoA-transferase family protein [Halobacterium wangiae]